MKKYSLIMFLIFIINIKAGLLQDKNSIFNILNKITYSCDENPNNKFMKINNFKKKDAVTIFGQNYSEKILKSLIKNYDLKKIEQSIEMIKHNKIMKKEIFSALSEIKSCQEMILSFWQRYSTYNIDIDIMLNQTLFKQKSISSKTNYAMLELSAFASLASVSSALNPILFIFFFPYTALISFVRFPFFVSSYLNNRKTKKSLRMLYQKTIIIKKFENFIKKIEKKITFAKNLLFYTVAKQALLELKNNEKLQWINDDFYKKKKTIINQKSYELNIENMVQFLDNLDEKKELFIPILKLIAEIDSYYVFSKNNMNLFN